VRDRQLLKRMQSVLDEEEARGEDDDAEDNDVDDEWKDLFAKPIVGKTAETPVMGESKTAGAAATPTTIPPSSAVTTTTTSTSTSPPSQMTTTQPPTLRNRNPTTTKPTPTPSQPATATSTSTNLNPTLPTKESALSASRLEQEDLTTALLSLASQLKASSQSFQATLENEKSILDRAVTGIDKTSSTMEAAGQRMGMLRRMTEGKGWWGRMMLYAWIFGLWVVAVLIVFVGPKLRF